MGWFWRHRAALAQWVRGGLAVIVVTLMAAASSGMLGTPAWASLMRPALSQRQSASADNSGGPTITLNVNSTLDEVDANPGDGTCASAANHCTLRAAVMEANLRGGHHTINVPAGTYNLTIPAVGGDNSDNDEPGSDAASGDLDMATDMDVIGASASNTIIDGGASMRVFSIESQRNANVQHVTIQNGLTTGSGGGIYSQGWLEISSVRLLNNSATEGGGAIYAERGELHLYNATITGNSAATGGGLFSSELSIYGSEITGNTSTLRGGGIYTFSGDIDSSIISGNSATTSNSEGGGIWIGSRIELSDSTVSGNSAAIGAGIWSADTIYLTNTTLTGNTATGNGSSTGIGGGLYFSGSINDSKLTSVTIANNSAPKGSGIYKGAGDLQVKNTIVATNSGSADCFRAGAIISLGNNLDGGTGCGFISTGDIQNTNPNLAALADNGGPTKTHALQAGSPAIDAGTNSGCPSTDQRGVQRPRDGDSNGSTICDIGAFEAPGTLGSLPPDNTDDDNIDDEDNVDYGDNTGTPGTPGQTIVEFAVCPGTTYVNVRSLTGFSIGDTVRINQGGSTQEDARVVDVGCNGTRLHLAGALQYRHQAGETVIIVGQSQASSISQPGDDRERSQPERRTEEQRLQAEQTNRSGRDDYHTEGDVAVVDFSKQPPEIVILTRDGRQTVQLLCGDQCPTIAPGDYVEVDGVKENEGLFQAETVTVTRR